MGNINIPKASRKSTRYYYCRYYDECLALAARHDIDFSCVKCKKYEYRQLILHESEVFNIIHLIYAVFDKKIDRNRIIQFFERKSSVVNDMEQIESYVETIIRENTKIEIGRMEVDKEKDNYRNNMMLHSKQIHP